MTTLKMTSLAGTAAVVLATLAGVAEIAPGAEHREQSRSRLERYGQDVLCVQTRDLRQR